MMKWLSKLRRYATALLVGAIQGCGVNFLYFTIIENRFAKFSEFPPRAWAVVVIFASIRLAMQMEKEAKQ